MMKPAAFGVHMHSGWGVLVALAGSPNSFEILDRRRIVIANPELPGAVQPYHFAIRLQPPQQAEHLAHCAASSSRMAATAMAQAVSELQQRHYRMVALAVLLASGRILPALEKILAAHTLIHSAEGEFFRDAARKACTDLEIPVTAIRERDLDEQARTAFGTSTPQVLAAIANSGRVVGPPWTRDHKAAALAALLLLASKG